MIAQTTVPTLDGLWVLLVANEGEIQTAAPAEQVPVMAQAGDNQKYLLVFKNVAQARAFVTASSLDGAVPRMVVRGNRDSILRIAKNEGVIGTLLDYDPSTQKYAAATALA